MKKIVGLVVAVVASAFVASPVMALSVIDSVALTAAETNLVDTLTAIGTMLITAGLVAIAFKWAKGALFG